MKNYSILPSFVLSVSLDAYKGKVAGANNRGATESWYHSHKEDCVQSGAVAIVAGIPDAIKSMEKGVSPSAVRSSLRYLAMQEMGKAEYRETTRAAKESIEWLPIHTDDDTGIYERSTRSFTLYSPAQVAQLALDHIDKLDLSPRKKAAVRACAVSILEHKPFTVKDSKGRIIGLRDSRKVYAFQQKVLSYLKDFFSRFDLSI